MASYQYPARSEKMNRASPTRDTRMNPGKNFFRSVFSHWRAAMTAQSHIIAPMFAASKSSHVRLGESMPPKMAQAKEKFKWL